MVVDDHPDAGRLLCRLLDRCGYHSCYCQSAQEALDVMGTVRPELAILDVMMPEMDGLSLLAAMRERPEIGALPVVMYSASTDESHRRRAAEMGADAFLIKGSVSIVELLGVVTRFGKASTDLPPV